MKPWKELDTKTRYQTGGFVGAVMVAVVWIVGPPSLLSRPAPPPVRPVWERPVQHLPPPSPRPPDPPGADVFRPLLGRWEGQRVEKTRGDMGCTLTLRIEADQKLPGQVNGYSSMKCASMSNIDLITNPECRDNALRCMHSIVEKMAPSEAVLVGQVADQAIAFKATENYGTTESGCDVSAVNVRGAGAGQLLIRWQDRCGGGDMELKRIGR